MNTIGRYRLLEKIGAGGMARVYRAHDPRLNRDVAIKVIHSTFAEDRDFRRKFEREATIGAGMEDLAVVPVYDVGDEGGNLYIVMRLMEGGTLVERIEGGSTTSLIEAVFLLQRLAPTLDAMHQSGIIHYDLKPSNILYSRTDDPYIGDFGVARIQQAHSRTGSSVLAFTPKYASPEQFYGKNVDSRSDIYSLGIIIYEMLAGESPFDADTLPAWMHCHLQVEVPNIRKKCPNLHPKIEAIFYKVLAKSPDARYSTAQEFLHDLNNVAGIEGGTGKNRSITPLGHASRFPRSFKQKKDATTRFGSIRQIGTFALIVIILVGLGIVALVNSGFLDKPTSITATNSLMASPTSTITQEESVSLLPSTPPTPVQRAATATASRTSAPVPESTSTRLAIIEPTRTAVPTFTEIPTSTALPTQTNLPLPTPTFVSTNTSFPLPSATIISTQVTQPPTPTGFREDCTAYDPTALQVVKNNFDGVDYWYLINGNMGLILFPVESDAQKAMALAQRYSQICYMGRSPRSPDGESRVSHYWKGETGVSTIIENEDCIPYDPNSLSVIDSGTIGWTLVGNGSMQMLNTPNEERAYFMMSVVQQYNQQCFIGRGYSGPGRVVINYWK
jgi:serine/threonine protein kinase